MHEERQRRPRAVPTPPSSSLPHRALHQNCHHHHFAASQVFLCTFQCSAWQGFPQYLAALHRLHGLSLTPLPETPQLAQASLREGAGLFVNTSTADLGCPSISSTPRRRAPCCPSLAVLSHIWLEYKEARAARAARLSVIGALHAGWLHAVKK